MSGSQEDSVVLGRFNVAKMGSHPSNERAFLASITQIALECQGIEYRVIVDLRGIIPKSFFFFVVLLCLPHPEKGFDGNVAVAHDYWVLYPKFSFSISFLFLSRLLQVGDKEMNRSVG